MVMLSSTRKMDARAAVAGIGDVGDHAVDGKRWKLRPRISMIEQKLQSKVQPRDVSTTSTGRPIMV